MIIAPDRRHTNTVSAFDFNKVRGFSLAERGALESDLISAHSAVEFRQRRPEPARQSPVYPQKYKFHGSLQENLTWSRIGWGPVRHIWAP